MKFLFLMAAFWLFAVPARAAEEISEYQLKAAFIVNFLKLSELPGHIDETGEDHPNYRLCVLESETVYRAFLETEGAIARKHPVNIFFRKWQDSLDSCDVLFIPEQPPARLQNLLASGRIKQTLTVGEQPDFCDRGGIIGFHILDGKLRFCVNLAQARAQQITFSSRLLRLATNVISDKGK